MNHLFKVNIKPLSTILIFVVLFSSCTNDDSVKPDSQELTGEEIFRAIFFWEGELATQMEVLRPGAEELNTRVSDEVLAEYAQFRDEIVSTIKGLDPEYFSNFKESMASENLYEVELGLVNAQKMFEAAGLASSYSEHFELLLEMKKKNVDVTDERLQNLDLTTEEDLEKFAQIFKEDYGIDLENVSSVAGRGHCFALAVVVAAVVAGNVVLVVNAAGAWNVAYSSNLNWTNNYQIPRVDTGGFSRVLVSEIAETVN